MAAGQQRLNCFFYFIALSPFFKNMPREQQRRRVKQLGRLRPLSRRHIPVLNARKSSRRLLAVFCRQRILYPWHAARSQPDSCVFLPCAWRLSAAPRVQYCMSCLRVQYCMTCLRCAVVMRQNSPAPHNPKSITPSLITNPRHLSFASHAHVTLSLQ